MMEEKTKLLNLMKFWLFGTFVIVWAAITAYIGMFTNRDWFMAIWAGRWIWGLTGVLAIIWYVFYRWWLTRDDGLEPSMMDMEAAPFEEPMEGDPMDAPDPSQTEM